MPTTAASSGSMRVSVGAVGGHDEQRPVVVDGHRVRLSCDLHILPHPQRRRVQADDQVVGGAGDPRAGHPPRPSLWAVADLAAAGDPTAAGVDGEDPVVLELGDVDRVATDGHQPGALSDVGAGHDPAGARVDPQQVARGLGDHPERSEPGGDPLGLRADGDRCPPGRCPGRPGAAGRGRRRSSRPRRTPPPRAAAAGEVDGQVGLVAPGGIRESEPAPALTTQTVPVGGRDADGPASTAPRVPRGQRGSGGDSGRGQTCPPVTPPGAAPRHQQAGGRDQQPGTAAHDRLKTASRTGAPAPGRLEVRPALGEADGAIDPDRRVRRVGGHHQLPRPELDCA